MAIADNPMLSSPEMVTKFNILHAVNKPLNELSVKELCSQAGISRDTFYRYFDSKYDIPVWHGKLTQSLYLDQVGRTTDWQTGYYHDFRLLAEEKKFCLCAYQNLGLTNNEFPEMNEHRKIIIMDTLAQWRHIDIDEDLLFCVESFVMLETILVTRWLRAGCNPEPEIFAERMVSVIPKRLFEAMQIQTE